MGGDGIDKLFEPWLERWRLIPDGEVIRTRHSRLLPVLSNRYPAILKIAMVEEERRGAALMDWYAGHGAAFVLTHESNALLLERISGWHSLAALARNGHDQDATRIICSVARLLHAPRDRPPPASLVPLPIWFRALERMARGGGIFAGGAATAQMLLSSPREEVVLHGDIHHGNILESGVRGWLAIDPKGLWGERGFDYANIFCNPDLAFAAAPGRLRAQAMVVAAEAQIEFRRLLQWILAYACLSAAWLIEEGSDPWPTIKIAEIAAHELTVS